MDPATSRRIVCANDDEAMLLALACVSSSAVCLAWLFVYAAMSTLEDDYSRALLYLAGDDDDDDSVPSPALFPRTLPLHLSWHYITL